MSKITAEQAAKEHASPLLDQADYNAAYESFCCGSAWHREQGIEWRHVSDGLPLIPEDCEWVNVLISDGLNVEKCDYSRAAFQIYPKPFTITHYAYINLPKTDKQ